KSLLLLLCWRPCLLQSEQICSIRVLRSRWSCRSVVLDEQSAASFLSRHLLRNSFDFELLVQGNLDRECIQEICSYEEAREIFEDDLQGLDFWDSYSSLSRVDVSGLVAGVLGALVCAVIATILGVYFYKSKKKKERRGARPPVRMEGDGGPVPEGVPLAEIIPPPLPSYGEALRHSGHYDGPPPSYSG
uniref:Proline rich Gla (G-carboxyglutamic acid) 2 n=1 Tax=Oryzias melastigma TaxID=30732 RepID=A0A3B3DHX5_ORYME